MAIKYEAEIGGKPFSMEAGKLAEQADGAVIVRYGDSVVLATAVASKEPREGADFFPLTVDYEERMYAAGKIPGGFIKRESRPSEAAILAMRLTDRPIRPLFPKGYYNDVQIVLTVLSTDMENDPDILALNGASAALSAVEYCAHARRQVATRRHRDEWGSRGRRQPLGEHHQLICIRRRLRAPERRGRGRRARDRLPRRRHRFPWSSPRRRGSRRWCGFPPSRE